jgi:hypothetical protein
MDIGIPIREFGDAVDTSKLREAVEALEEPTWRLNDYRQQTYEVHRQTESVVMIFTDGSGWPNIEVSKEPGWDLLAETAMPVMHEIIEKFYPPGGTIVRAMAAKLLQGGIIRPHKDSHPSFHAGHRIHIPIRTNARVRFMLDGRPYKFEVGKSYEINNQLTHSVMNKGKEDRIHFIFDYIPPTHSGRTELAGEPEQS